MCFHFSHSDVDCFDCLRRQAVMFCGSEFFQVGHSKVYAVTSQTRLLIMRKVYSFHVVIMFAQMVVFDLWRIGKKLFTMFRHTSYSQSSSSLILGNNGTYCLKGLTAC